MREGGREIVCCWSGRCELIPFVNQKIIINPENYSLSLFNIKFDGVHRFKRMTRRVVILHGTNFPSSCLTHAEALTQANKLTVHSPRSGMTNLLRATAGTPLFDFSGTSDLSSPTFIAIYWAAVMKSCGVPRSDPMEISFDLSADPAQRHLIFLPDGADLGQAEQYILSLRNCPLQLNQAKY